MGKYSGLMVPVFRIHQDVSKALSYRSLIRIIQVEVEVDKNRTREIYGPWNSEPSHARNFVCSVDHVINTFCHVVTVTMSRRRYAIRQLKSNEEEEA